MREVELKFTASRAFSLDGIRGRAGVAAVNALESQQLTSAYYDTTDVRLARSGVTLRFRTGGSEPVWTVKLPVGGTNATVREELNYAGAEDQVPSEALELLIGHCRAAAVLPVATLETHRARWRLLDAEGEELAIVCDDDVAVVERGRTLTRFREVELESSGVDLERLHSLGAALSDAGAVPIEAVPKAVRALGPRATAPPDLPVVDETVPLDTPAAVQRMIVHAADRITSNHAAARLGAPKGVHDMRVGARRLGSDLVTFAPLIDEPWSTVVIDDLKWLVGVLGRVRDSDVMAERIARRAGDLSPVLRPLFEALDDEARQHREALHETLRSERYRMLLEMLVRAAQNPPLAHGVGPAAATMVALIRPRWKQLRRAVRTAGRHPTDDALHDVRIELKGMRYGAEALAPTLPRPRGSARFARRAAKLQDVLGAHQDAVVSQRRLRQHAAVDGRSNEYLIAIGRLIEREAAAARASRRRWRTQWRKLRADEATRWLAE